MSLGRPPPGIAGLLQNQVAVHELALQALLVDPVVSSLQAAEGTNRLRQRAALRYFGHPDLESFNRITFSSFATWFNTG